MDLLASVESSMTSTSTNAMNLLGLSQALADAVAQTAPSIVAFKGGRRSSASGIHWRSGIIVTTDHSLKQEDEIPVVLDNRTTTATLIGRDSGTDLAVLRLKQEPSIPVAPIHSGNEFQVGHLVLAVGRSSDMGATASLGVISALGGAWRTWNGGQIDQFIRPDITLYAGGSGSALINLQGQVLGINTTTHHNHVLTIPAQTVDRVIEQLLQRGRIVRGYLGVGMQPVQLPAQFQQAFNLSDTGGVLVMSVEPKSPADQAGVLIGDVVVKLGDRRVGEIQDVHQRLDPEQVGKPLQAELIRGGQLITVTIVVGERPRRTE
ncbi:MAG: trypsin-like peptidase domain-containing protein [Elainellaceae cyanobacterium]